MLIIKKYHDYYDTSIGFGGIDKTCVYNRIPELKPIDYRFEGEKDVWGRGPYIYDDQSRRYTKQLKNHISLIKPFVIGFCGKTYVGYLFHWESLGETYKQEIVYNIEDFNKYKQFDMKYKYENKKQKMLEDYYNQFHNKPNPDIFFQYHIPVFVADFGTHLYDYETIETSKGFNRHKLHLIINPILSVYEFYKIMPSVQAFQEIQMYLQGVLGNKEKEIVDISEKDKILQHGFDYQWSFRNPCPPNRKKGKCKI